MSVAAYFSIFKFFRAPILCSLYRIGALKKLKIEKDAAGLCRWAVVRQIRLN